MSNPVSHSVGLYVHIPWCVRKCPYCDFNSHEAQGDLPIAAYVDALLRDLESELEQIPDVSITSVFFGGGTPSLLPGPDLARIMAGIRSTGRLHENAEVTLEANPGASDEDRFSAFRAAGVNRLSIGVQSFDNDLLRQIGRIHDGDAARSAIAAAGKAGFSRLNIDLMYGLPQQTPAMAQRDLCAAVDAGAEHISWYQLTIEPNTAFHSKPPTLPLEEALSDMEQTGFDVLHQSNFARYEVSAWARRVPSGGSAVCAHNLNYWQYGDYLGVGAGAHGKVTVRKQDGDEPTVLRYQKSRMPQDYIEDPSRRNARRVHRSELAGEYLLNALRLPEGTTIEHFCSVTGLAEADLEPARSRLIKQGLLRPDTLAATQRGYRWLDAILAEFV